MGFVIENGVLLQYKEFSAETVVRVPDTVHTIGVAAFRQSRFVERVILPETIIKIEKLAFASCRRLHEINFPDFLREIGNCAFIDCDLQKVEIPESVVRIGSCAFSGCRWLQSVSVPDRIQEIGALAFYHTPWLEDAAEEWVTINGFLLRYNGTETDVVMPEGIRVVDSYAFFHRRKLLKTMRLASTVRVLRAKAFCECSRMQSIVFPEYLQSIGERAFSDCTALESVVIPNSVLVLSDGLFFNCVNLKTITLPEQLQSIPASLFESCCSLREIRIPESVHTIDENAFYECSSLWQIHFPEKLHTLKSKAFKNCFSLKRVEVSDNLRNVGHNCFEECEALEEFCLYSGDVSVEFPRYLYHNDKEMQLVWHFLISADDKRSKLFKQITNTAQKHCLAVFMTSVSDAPVYRAYLEQEKETAAE